MKYRIIREKEVCFWVYYPQYSEDGKEWEVWWAITCEPVPVHFYSIETAKNFIKRERLKKAGPEVVWESEE